MSFLFPYKWDMSVPRSIYLFFYAYSIYLEPTWPLFLKVNPTKQGLFQSKQVSWKGSRYYFTNTDKMETWDLHLTFILCVVFSVTVGTCQPWQPALAWRSACLLTPLKHRPFVIGGHPAFASGFDLVVCCGVLFLGVEKRMGMKVKGVDINN